MANIYCDGLNNVKYGSRILTIAGIQYVAEVFEVDISDTEDISGMAEVQLVDDIRPQINDGFSTSIEGNEVRLMIKRIWLLERNTELHKARCLFCQVK